MITGAVVGTEGVILHLSGTTDRVNRRLRQEVDSLAIKVLQRVQVKLSGEVLKNRTGNLRASVHPDVEETANSVTGIVGTNCEYAAAHEYGFNGMVTVAAHLRRSKAQMKAAMYRRKNSKGEMITKYSSKGRKRGAIRVKSFQRHMVLPERAFLRQTLYVMRGTIINRLREAAGAGINAKS